MLSSRTYTILWLTFDILGQLALFLLLSTFVLVKSLRQRSNPFLINFLLTVLLGGFPPYLLIFTGDIMNKDPPKSICLVQSVLMDGIPPMIAIAFLVLVFNTWADLRAMLSGATSVAEKVTRVRWLLVLAPYVTFMSWCTASLAAALLEPALLQPINITIYCENNSSLGNHVRSSVGLFVFSVVVLVLVPEICICRFVYANFSRSKERILSDSYYVGLPLGLRILILWIWELVIILLEVPVTSSLPKAQATKLLWSLNCLITFLVFGTQSDVLRAWKPWKDHATWKSWKDRATPDPDRKPATSGSDNV